MGARDSLVRIYVLGGFRVWVGSRAIDAAAWRLRKARNLVKILALTPQHHLHREQVLEFLWPDFRPDAAANNLHQTLHVARRAFASASPDAAVALQLRQEVVSLEPLGGIWVDAEAFERSASVARTSGHAAAYEEAVQLYDGALLPEDRYEEWTLERREGLQSLYVEVLVSLSRHQDAAGDVARALGLLHQAVSVEPTNEDAQGTLMDIYARLGRQQDSLRQFRELQTTLRREAEAEPGAKTAGIQDDIIAGRYLPDGERNVPDVQTLAPALTTPRASRRRQKAIPSNLPEPLSSFVGRVAELKALRGRLEQDRLLTLTGPAGTGKTRLALELAGRMKSHFAEGPWWIDLAPLSDGELIDSAIASGLRIRSDRTRSIADALATRLRGKAGLIILDNCEHLLEPSASAASALLSACPELKIVATSRQALNLPGETQWRVQPLSLPPEDLTTSPDRLSEYEAINLFTTRGRAANSAFALTSENADAVTEICRRLDGLPLAIELAAVRTRHLSVTEILQRLRDRFSLLALPGMPPRHRSMRTAIDWSYAMLGETEQTLFNRLSVFAGNFSLEAVEAICGERYSADWEVLESLLSLVDRALVEIDETQNGAVRYRLLETMREYAAERLAARGEREVIVRRHRDFFLHLAEESESHRFGPEVGQWLKSLEGDHANLRSALAWSLETAHEEEGGLRLASALRGFWQLRGHLAEARTWYEKALEQKQEPTIWRARVLNALAGALNELSEGQRSPSLYEESLGLFRALGDKDGIARVTTNLGSMASAAKNYSEARRLFEESLALCREIGDQRGIAFLLVKLGNLALKQDELENAITFYERAQVLYGETGDRAGTAWALNWNGLALRVRGDFPRARARFMESLEIYEELNELYDRPMVHLNLGYVAQHDQDYDAASQHFLKAADQCREMGDRLGLATAAAAQAGIFALQGEHEQAVVLFAAAEKLRTTLGPAWVPTPQLAGPPIDREDNARNLATARAALGEARFAQMWEAGLRLTVEDALAKALPEPAQVGGSA